MSFTSAKHIGHELKRRKNTLSPDGPSGVRQRCPAAGAYRRVRRSALPYQCVSRSMSPCAKSTGTAIAGQMPHVRRVGSDGDRYRHHRLDDHGRRARAADDAGPFALLRGDDEGEGRPEHDDDVVRQHHRRHRRCGCSTALARVRRGGVSALNNIVGGLDAIGLRGCSTATADDGTGMPSLVSSAFQLTFAIITVALISGAIADRAKFGAWVVFAASGRPRLLPRRPLGLGRRLARQPRHRGLRRRHRGPHQRRSRGASPSRSGARQAARLAQGADAAAQPAARPARRGPAVVRLVRLQRRLRARPSTGPPRSPS